MAKATPPKPVRFILIRTPAHSSDLQARASKQNGGGGIKTRSQLNSGSRCLLLKTSRLGCRQTLHASSASPLAPASHNAKLQRGKKDGGFLPASWMVQRPAGLTHFSASFKRTYLEGFVDGHSVKGLARRMGGGFATIAVPSRGSGLEK